MVNRSRPFVSRFPRKLAKLLPSSLAGSRSFGRCTKRHVASMLLLFVGLLD